MESPETVSSSASHLGRVKNGVVVFDAHPSLNEGQAVRIEPLGTGESEGDKECADRVRRLQQLFAEWTEEDSKLSNEEADLLHTALEQNRGLSFRSPKLD